MFCLFQPLKRLLEKGFSDSAKFGCSANLKPKNGLRLNKRIISNKIRYFNV